MSLLRPILWMHFEPQREREIDREFWHLLRPIFDMDAFGQKKHWLYFVPCYGCHLGPITRIELTSSHVMDAFGPMFPAYFVPFCYGFIWEPKFPLYFQPLFDFLDKSAFGCSSSVDEECLDYCTVEVQMSTTKLFPTWCLSARMKELVYFVPC